jgi:hypothetical protein
MATVHGSAKGNTPQFARLRHSETFRGSYPIGSMVLLYMVAFSINIPPMLAYVSIYTIHGSYGYSKPKADLLSDFLSEIVKKLNML